MGRAYSDDLRERVARSVVDGRTCRETARLFGVSVASAVKWSQRLRATGSAGAKPQGRKQPRSLAAERAWLLERLEGTPDVTLRRLVAELGERGVVTSYGSVWRIVREAGITFKKRCSPPSRTGQPWPGGGRNGASTRAGLIPGGWSSSTRAGRKTDHPGDDR